MHTRLAQDQSVDSTGKVLGSILMSVSLSKPSEIIDVETTTASTERTSRNNGETHLHLTRACVEHNAQLRKTNAALCRGKQNATLFYNPGSRCENGNAG